MPRTHFNIGKVQLAVLRCVLGWGGTIIRREQTWLTADGQDLRSWVHHAGERNGNLDGSGIKRATLGLIKGGYLAYTDDSSNALVITALGKQALREAEHDSAG